jgi:GNAT superfamily N-acetyltransferase
MSVATGSLRALRRSDVPDAMALSSLAGWNQRPRDWQLLLELNPAGCLGIEVDGRVVATATLVTYGRRLAWVGMVLTHPDFRRQGLARRLMSTVLDRARSSGIQTLKLDATDEGESLYASFGFRAEQPVERWVREGAEALACEKSTASVITDVSEIDQEACGFDRTTLLRLLASGSNVSSTEGAYVFCRPGRLFRYIGPCVSRNPEMANRLVSSCIRKSPAAPWAWDLLPQNTEAVRLARALGFVQRRVLTRMVLGEDLRGKENWIYAIAGFELG